MPVERPMTLLRAATLALAIPVLGTTSGCYLTGVLSGRGLDWIPFEDRPLERGDRAVAWGVTTFEVGLASGIAYGIVRDDIASGVYGSLIGAGAGLVGGFVLGWLAHRYDWSEKVPNAVHGALWAGTTTLVLGGGKSEPWLWGLAGATASGMAWAGLHIDTDRGQFLWLDAPWEGIGAFALVQLGNAATARSDNDTFWRLSYGIPVLIGLTGMLIMSFDQPTPARRATLLRPRRITFSAGA